AKDQRLALSLRQRNSLLVVVQHVFPFDRNRSDVQNLVTAIDNVALACYEDSLSLRQKNLFNLAGLVGKPEEFQIDRRRGRGALWDWSNHLMNRDHRFWNVDLGSENVSPRASILRIFAGPEPVIP